jgi:hypothetical protein
MGTCPESGEPDVAHAKSSMLEQSEPIRDSIFASS